MSTQAVMTTQQPQATEVDLLRQVIEETKKQNSLLTESIEKNQALSLEPKSWEDLIKWAEIAAKTSLVPKDYRGNPYDIAIAVQYGRELGFTALQSLSGIAVVNGRASVWGDLFWALVTTHPDYEDCIQEVGPKGAKVTLKRRGRSPVTVEFNEQDAARAGLLNKPGPWKDYTPQMYLYRARTFAGRMLFADRLKGMTSVEEARDYPTIEGQYQEVGKQQPSGDKKETISDEQAGGLVKLAREHGRVNKELRDYLKEKTGFSSLLDVTVDRYEDVVAVLSMPKAGGAPQTKPAAPAQQQNGKQSEQQKPAADPPPEVSEDEKMSRESFAFLGWDTKTQDRFLNQYKQDWKVVRTELSILIDKRAEQG